MTLRLLSYNIRFGGHGREQALAETIVAAAPDLVVFQEATDPAVIERLAEATKFPFWAARHNHSIGFLSRTEVDYHEWHYPAGARHSFLEIVPAGSDARIFGLHLSARFSKWDERRRTREIRSLLDGIKRHQNGFHALVGDFNTLAPGEVLEIDKLPAWIRALIWISGRKLQRETIQLMLDAGYGDGYRMLHADEKGYTFPTWDPHVRLDYVFVPKAFADRLEKCEVIAAPKERIRAASDHCPLLVELGHGSDG
ncbi:MAG TPA: endonuclease/exonuclease/phosphatase family protein [Pyrinomonadaceae bacterium]|nr:endonuclease/exonuclease/phosphatase family protein [Pyrinomonadaceae bacterium]